jgi:hypothetical protein
MESASLVAPLLTALGRALKKLWGSDAPPLALLATLWIAAAIIVDPRGEYYTGDDWAFAESVKALVIGRGFILSDWAAMNLISHILWGAGFASVFGYSITVLRFSTLALGLIAGVAAFRLFRLAGTSRAIALLGALTSIFNPFFFALSFSFMTDVPYAAMQLVSMWLIAEGMMRKNAVRHGIGWLIAVAVLLCRQTGLVIPLGFLAEALTRQPWNFTRFALGNWRRYAIGLSALASLTLVQWSYTAWLTHTENVPRNYGYQVHTIAVALTQRTDLLLAWVLEFVSDSFFYLGLALLPLTLASMPRWLELLPARLRAAALFAVVLTGEIVFVAQSLLGELFPMWRNTFSRRNGFGGDEPMGTPMPHEVEVILTALASLGGVLLLCALAGAVFSWLRQRPINRFDIPVFSLTIGLATLAPVAFITFRFDRYLIPALPCVALALTVLLARQYPSRGTLLASYAALIAMGSLTVVAMHDVVAYKRVHFDAYTRLIETVPARFVNAQWVANLSQNYEHLGKPREVENAFERACYVISVTEEHGYRTIETLPVRRWMPGNEDGPPILVQKRNQPYGAQPCMRDSGRREPNRRAIRNSEVQVRRSNN